jgi:hypothetical protein
MPYTKQHAVLNNTPAIAAEITENFEDVRRYVNQGIISADIVDDSIDFADIVKGELTMFSGPEHQFTTGQGYGIYSSGTAKQNGFTNTTKQEYLSSHDQATGFASNDHRVENIITIPDSGKEIFLEHKALITYRCFMDIHIYENTFKDPYDLTIQPTKHRGTTKIWLSTDGGKTQVKETTEGRFYDESVFSSGGFTSSWDGPLSEDPMRDTVVPDGFSNNINSFCYRRQYVMFKQFVLSPGTYKLCAVVDAHHETGLIQAQNVSIEVEFVGSGI